MDYGPLWVWHRLRRKLSQVDYLLGAVNYLLNVQFVNPEQFLGFYVRNTVAELRAVPYAANKRYAIVFGNLAPGDAQNRTYWWKDSETGDDDGISIIRPTSQPGGTDGAWVEL